MLKNQEFWVFPEKSRFSEHVATWILLLLTSNFFGCKANLLPWCRHREPPRTPSYVLQKSATPFCWFLQILFYNQNSLHVNNSVFSMLTQAQKLPFVLFVENYETQYLGLKMFKHIFKHIFLRLAIWAKRLISGASNFLIGCVARVWYMMEAFTVMQK